MVFALNYTSISFKTYLKITVFQLLGKGKKYISQGYCTIQLEFSSYFTTRENFEKIKVKHKILACKFHCFFSFTLNPTKLWLKQCFSLERKLEQIILLSTVSHEMTMKVIRIMRKYTYAPMPPLLENAPHTLPLQTAIFGKTSSPYI